MMIKEFYHISPKMSNCAEIPRFSLHPYPKYGIIAEQAACNVLVLTLVYIIAVFIYEVETGWNGILAVGWTLFEHSTKFIASATILIVSREGGDIMLFHRWEAARKRHAEQVAQAKDEGRAEGRNEGFAQGRDAVQQEWTAWNARRLEAETKGQPFNEPPPHSPRQL